MQTRTRTRQNPAPLHGHRNSEAKRLKELESENTRLRKLLDRLYAEAALQVKRRKRRTFQSVDDNHYSGQGKPIWWSMDFVVYRSADGQVIKCRAAVDDAAHESVANVQERATGGR